MVTFEYIISRTDKFISNEIIKCLFHECEGKKSKLNVSISEATNQQKKSKHKTFYFMSIATGHRR